MRLTASPIPAALLLQAVAFLKAVFKLYHREAVALLAWPEGRPGPKYFGQDRVIRVLGPL